MGKLKDFLRRITGFRIFGSGIDFAPQNPPPSVSETTGPSQTEKEPSNGDWIAAGIVAPERAIAVLQRIVTSAKSQRNTHRQKRIDKIRSAVTKEISVLRKQYETGGKTDGGRCEAYIAKFTADILDREMASYLWKVNEETDTDPLDVLNRVIRNLIKHGAL